MTRTSTSAGLSVGLWACRNAGVTVGHHVLITGAGPIGLLALQAALARGATSITITDVNQHRLRTAERLGARAIHISQTSHPLSESLADFRVRIRGGPIR